VRFDINNFTIGDDFPSKSRLSTNTHLSRINSVESRVKPIVVTADIGNIDMNFSNFSSNKMVFELRSDCRNN
jgi:hypothetical protein